VRGAESDILSRDTAAPMAARQPSLRRVEVDGVGRAPTLSEPDVGTALDAFYDDAAAAPRSLSGRGTAWGR
jgi:hypothetical protein